MNLTKKNTGVNPLKIAIFGQAYKTESIGYIVQLIQILKKKNCKIAVVDEMASLLDSETYAFIETFSGKKPLDTKYDFFISVGGDGTILRAAGIIKDSNTPIIGINTGRLGFLATVQKELLAEAVEALLNHNYRIVKRSLLEVHTDKEIPELSVNFALNEVSVSRKNTMSMIMIETYLDGEFLNTYWADGLIIATPTGSTGYSMSCNGPIVTPQVQALTITPIAPHNLSIRPLVIRDDTQITLKIKSREEMFLLSMDNRVVSLSDDTEIFIQKTGFQLQMIELHNQSFLKTLREKLLWGKDNRNY